MRWVVWFVLAFAIAVGLAFALHVNQGNVAIFWPPYRIEVSLNFAVLALLAVFLAAHLLLVVTGKVLSIPQRFRNFRDRRRRDKATLSLHDGLLAFFEGRYGRVERIARAATSLPVTASAAALLAARAADQMNEPERRETWLEKAATDTEAAAALAMTRAEFALEQGRALEAVDLISRLQESGARHLAAQRLLVRAYESLERWDDLMPVLRSLQKRKALANDELARLRERTFRGQLAQAQAQAQVQSQAALRQVWRGLRSDERLMPDLVLPALQAFARAGLDAEACRMAEQALDAGLDERLLRAYANLPAASARDRLEHLEGWLERHGEQAMLLWALGVTCTREQIWGKAEDYLTRAQALESSAAVLLALAELYELTERSAEAGRAFRDSARFNRA